MKRSFALAQFWLRPVSPSLGSECSRQSSVSGTSHTLAQGPSRQALVRANRYLAGFTLIELLVVVAVIVVLAGITLAAMSGVQGKAARDRTRAEVAAIVNALERYKSQHDRYPAAVGSNLPYADISAYLPASASSLTTNGAVVTFCDPYGTPYFYRNPGSNNIATFDVWSTAGASDGETHKHIGNW